MSRAPPSQRRQYDIAWKARYDAGKADDMLIKCDVDAEMEE